MSQGFACQSEGTSRQVNHAGGQTLSFWHRARIESGLVTGKIRVHVHFSYFSSYFFLRRGWSMVDNGKTLFCLLTWLLSRPPPFPFYCFSRPGSCCPPLNPPRLLPDILCATRFTFSKSSFPSFSSSPRPPLFSSPTRPFVHSLPAPKQGRFCSLCSLSPLYLVLFIRPSVWIWIHTLFTPCSQRHALHPHLDFRPLFFSSSLYSVLLIL